MVMPRMRYRPGVPCHPASPGTGAWAGVLPVRARASAATMPFDVATARIGIWLIDQYCRWNAMQVVTDDAFPSLHTATGVNPRSPLAFVCGGMFRPLPYLTMLPRCLDSVDDPTCACTTSSMSWRASPTD